jgi:hypothetical protein
MAKVLAILTLDQVREMNRYAEKMELRDERWGGLVRSEFVVTFERDGERYQCKMCDCDSVELQAYQEAWIRVVGEAQPPSFWKNR